MKKKLLIFINNPLRVTVVSLVIAVGIFAVIHTQITASAEQRSQRLLVDTKFSNTHTTSQEHLSLAFLSGGRIAEVPVHAGDKVTKGMVLASLDQKDTNGVIVTARATLAIAHANYQKVLNGATGPAINVARTTLTNAKINLDAVTKRQLIVNAVPGGAPVILNQGILDGRYAWRVQMPLLVTYRSSSDVYHNTWIVTMVITRVSAATHERGIAINQINFTQGS